MEHPTQTLHKRIGHHVIPSELDETTRDLTLEREDLLRRERDLRLNPGEARDGLEPRDYLR